MIRFISHSKTGLDRRYEMTERSSRDRHTHYVCLTEDSTQIKARHLKRLSNEIEMDYTVVDTVWMDRA
jgi:hypothetical protein